jgi:hypothetical protein
VLSELPDGSGLILDLETKFYFTLNPTGLVVWKVLGDADGVTAADLAKALVDAFDVEPSTALDDVQNLLRRLLDEGLVGPVAEEASPGDAP